MGTQKIFVLSIFEWPFYTDFTVQKIQLLLVIIQLFDPEVEAADKVEVGRQI